MQRVRRAAVVAVAFDLDLGLAGLAFVDLSQERVERALDNRGGVAVRNLVGEQILELLEFVARILAEGYLQAVAAR